MTSRTTGACWRAETQVRAIHRRLAASWDGTRVGFTRART